MPIGMGSRIWDFAAVPTAKVNCQFSPEADIPRLAAKLGATTGTGAQIAGPLSLAETHRVRANPHGE